MEDESSKLPGGEDDNAAESHGAIAKVVGGALALSNKELGGEAEEDNLPGEQEESEEKGRVLGVEGVAVLAC